MISRSLYGFLAFSIVICVFGKVSFGRSSEPDREMEQVTYLGVRTESLAPAMSKQLSLPMGLHLSVVRVGPDSPAEKAGLREFDVLLKLDEQILVNEDNSRSWSACNDLRIQSLSKSCVRGNFWMWWWFWRKPKFPRKLTPHPVTRLCMTVPTDP